MFLLKKTLYWYWKLKSYISKYYFIINNFNILCLGDFYQIKIYFLAKKNAKKTNFLFSKL